VCFKRSRSLETPISRVRGGLRPPNIEFWLLAWYPAHGAGFLYWFLYSIVFLVLGFETLNLKDLDYGISARVL